MIMKCKAPSYMGGGIESNTIDFDIQKFATVSNPYTIPSLNDHYTITGSIEIDDGFDDVNLPNVAYIDYNIQLTRYGTTNFTVSLKEESTGEIVLSRQVEMINATASIKSVTVRVELSYNAYPVLGQYRVTGINIINQSDTSNVTINPTYIMISENLTSTGYSLKFE